MSRLNEGYVFDKPELVGPPATLNILLNRLGVDFASLEEQRAAVSAWLEINAPSQGLLKELVERGFIDRVVRRPVEEFAVATLRRYRGVLPTSVVDDVRQDIAAGDCEVAAITIVEMAPVTAAEVDELEGLAEQFTQSRDLKALAV